jgi:SIR2-like domain
MDLADGIARALDGTAILFTGAGFSCDADNLNGEPIKKGAAFASHLAQAAGLPLDTSLEDASQEYTDQFGIDALLRELTTEFTAKRVSEGQREIAKIPWKRIYTTNYDNVIEVAHAETGGAITPVTLSTDIRQIPKDRKLSVHLNGYINSASRANVLSEIKLTDTSYVTASIATSPWATLFRQDLAAARAVFFIGYSLTDLDLRRLLADDALLSAKSLYIIGNSPDLATVRRVRRFGTALQLSTEDFANHVRGIAATYTPAVDAAPLSYCVQRYVPSTPTSPLADKNVFDLISIGDLRENYLWSALHGGDPYVVPRKAVDQALAALSGGARLVAIHSSLGNGKTVVLESLKAAAADQGYTVQVLTHQGESLISELEQALKAPQPILFVIDNYPRWLNALRFFGTTAPEGTSLLVSARTSAHDVLVDRLTEVTPVEDIVEIDVDRLTDLDVTNTVEYLDHYGLWAERSAWTARRKEQFLRNDCKAQWHAILLKIFESPQIASRFEAIFGEIERHEPYYESLIGILVLAVLGFPLTVATLVDLCGPSVLETHFKRNAAVRELVNFAVGEVRMRSSVASEFILHKIADPNIIVKVLIALATAADKASSASIQHTNIVRSLGTFSNLMTVLPDVDRGRAALRLFESIKDLSQNATNPQFWLQYAIACMFADELTRAERYFAAAYAFASRRPNYNTNQIDNHYARLLLTRALRRTDVLAAMTDFRDARAIIFRQIQNERLHYPFRVATKFGRFYETFASRLTPVDREEIGRAAEFIEYRIKMLPPYRREQRYVSECLLVMRRLIQEALPTKVDTTAAATILHAQAKRGGGVGRMKNTVPTHSIRSESVACPSCQSVTSVQLGSEVGSTSTARCTSCTARFSVHRKTNVASVGPLILRNRPGRSGR